MGVLAEVLPPTSGNVFVPPHARVLHVEATDTLYKAPVADNVFFALMGANGVSSVSDLRQEDLDRGIRICKRLHIMDEVIRAIQHHQSSPGRLLENLPRTTRLRIQLARALIASPEVLVIHTPVDILPEDKALSVMGLLREFVYWRGVEVPKEDLGQRRARTCIITSTRPKILAEVDQVFCVEGGAILSSSIPV